MSPATIAGGAGLDLRERGLLARAAARRSVFVAALGLWLLAGLAVLAPLVANDAPWYVRGIDRAEHASLVRSLGPLARSFERLERMDDAVWLRERTAGSTLAREEAMRRELDALDLRVGRIAEQLAAPVPELEGLARAIAAREGVARAAESASKALEARTELLARSRWPLPASLGARDVLALGAWIAAGVALAAARRGRRVALGAWIALAVVTGATVVTALLAGAGDPGARGWKERLASPSFELERVVFAPIPMGYAETNASETWRPPTWLASSAIDDEGRYVDAPPPSGSALHVAPPAPVVVRPGEPERNAWNRHLLGTDGLGRDVAARVLWGARASLSIGFGAALLLATIGTLVGALAGTLGGLVDRVVSRVLEVVLCFPAFFLVLAFAAVADPRVFPPALTVALVIGLVGWTGVARLVRAECMKLAGAEFVLAARAQGFSTPRVLFVHVLPNALAPALVALSLAVGTAILTESALSFLGLGVEIPVPSWGALAAESRDLGHWWMLAFPGGCVFASAVLANVLGEGVRDALDPRADDGGGRDG